jgi:ribonuclease BN (tRNA processing enzyme)
MEALRDKGAISQETVVAVKSLLSLKLNEKTGQTYDQWMQAGTETRRQKIEQTTASLKELGTKIEEERKNASPEKMDFKTAKDLSSYFQEKTGDSIELAKTKIAGVEMRNRMRANGNPVGEVPTLKMENIPYSKDQIKLIKKHQDLAKKSKNLFHTTTRANIESIAQEGLQTGNAKRYDVSKEGRLYFSANEEAAKYFG